MKLPIYRKKKDRTGKTQKERGDEVWWVGGLFVRGKKKGAMTSLHVLPKTASNERRREKEGEERGTKNIMTGPLEGRQIKTRLPTIGKEKKHQTRPQRN